MNAEQYLNVALGGNMNIGTLKPLAWYEIMEGYAQHKIDEAAHSTSDNKQMDAIAVSKDQAIEFAKWWYGPESSGQYAKDGFETWWAQQHH